MAEGRRRRRPSRIVAMRLLDLGRPCADCAATSGSGLRKEAMLNGSTIKGISTSSYGLRFYCSTPPELDFVSVKLWVYLFFS